MNEKYQQLIETMAAKLGTTAEHLWGVLVKQAPISGAVDLMLCVVITAAAVWWASFVNRKTTCPPETEACRYPKAEWSTENAIAARLSVFIAVAVAFLCIIGSVHGIVAAFANPEYWALKQLIK